MTWLTAQLNEQFGESARLEAVNLDLDAAVRRNLTVKKIPNQALFGNEGVD